MNANAESPSLHDVILKYLERITEATARLISASCGVDQKQVALELNRMFSAGTLARDKRPGANEYWYWVATADNSDPGERPPVVQDTVAAAASIVSLREQLETGYNTRPSVQPSDKPPGPATATYVGPSIPTTWNETKPKAFVPVAGEYAMLHRSGIDETLVLLMDEYTHGRWHIEYIDGGGSGGYCAEDFGPITSPLLYAIAKRHSAAQRAQHHTKQAQIARDDERNWLLALSAINAALNATRGAA